MRSRPPAVASFAASPPRPWLSARRWLAAPGGPAAWRNGRPAPTLLVLVVVDQMRADYLDALRGALHRRLPPAASTQGAGLRADVLSLSEHRDLRRPRHARHRRLAQDPRHHPQRVVPPRAGPRCGRARPMPTRTPVAVQRRAREGGPQRRASCACRRWPSGCAARWPDSRAVSLAVKPRSAVMMAGKGATAVTWVGVDGWQTSTAFARAPVPEVVRALGPRPFERERGIGLGTRCCGRGDLRRAPTPASASGRRPAGPTCSPIRCSVREAPAGVHRALADESLSPTSSSAPWPRRWSRLPARAARRRRFPRRQLPRHRQGRARLRARQPRAAGHAGPARPHARHAADGARSPGRPRSLRARRSRPITAWPRCPRRGGPTARAAGRVRAGDGGRHGERRAHRRGPRAGTARGARRVHRDLPHRGGAGRRSPPRSIAPALAAMRALPGVRTAVWTPDAGARSTGLATRWCGRCRPASSPTAAATSRSRRRRTGSSSPDEIRTAAARTTHGSSNDYDQHVPLVFLGAPFAPGRVHDAATPADARADAGRHRRA